MLRLHIRAPVLVDAELIEEPVFRPQETHRQEHELSLKDPLRAGNLLRLEAAVIFDPFNPDRMQFAHLAVVADAIQFLPALTERFRQRLGAPSLREKAS